ncbi:transglycosylase SLT domain-containing protein [Candidatus Nomurabacteria bacterium]|nr:transglycosylase SLT domain-containing protein [Candidatus Nomurabacteria bacterium]
MNDKDLSTALTLKDLIETKAEEAGVDKTLALKIAFCESTMRQFDKSSGKPLRGVHNPNDVGLFQINEDYHANRSQNMGHDIYSTEGNIDYALYLLKKEGSRPWNASRPCWGNTTTV